MYFNMRSDIKTRIPQNKIFFKLSLAENFSESKLHVSLNISTWKTAFEIVLFYFVDNYWQQLSDAVQSSQLEAKRISSQHLWNKNYYVPTLQHRMCLEMDMLVTTWFVYKNWITAANNGNVYNNLELRLVHE